MNRDSCVKLLAKDVWAWCVWNTVFARIETRWVVTSVPSIPGDANRESYLLSLHLLSGESIGNPSFKAIED